MSGDTCSSPAEPDKTFFGKGEDMAEYIERESMIKHLDILYDRMYAKNPQFYAGFMIARNFVNDFLAADVAPVVRCRCCRFWGADGRCEAPVNGLVREYTKETDFCSYGERRKPE